MSFRSQPAAVRAIAVARGASFLGDEVALLAMAFRAKAELGHFGVAAVLIAGMAPLLVLGPLAGLMVDRRRLRPLLVAVGLAQAGVCVALAWSDAVTLVPLVALLGAGTAISMPAWQAQVAALVRDDQLPGAMGLVQTAAAVAGLGGPFLGGYLVGTFGFHSPLLVDAASFALLAAAPLVLRIDRRPAPVASGERRRGAAFAGYALIWRSPMLRSLLVLATLFVLSLGMVNVVEIFFVTTALHAGPRGYGLLGMCMAAGMLVASAASGALAQRVRHPGRLFLAGCVGLCAGLGAFGVTGALWEAALVVVFVGASNALVNVNANVILLRAAGADVHGRVLAAVQGTISAAQIGSMALGGLLLVHFAPRSIILVGAAACAAVLCVTVAPLLRADVDATAAAEAVPASLGTEALPA